MFPESGVIDGDNFSGDYLVGEFRFVGDNTLVF